MTYDWFLSRLPTSWVHYSATFQATGWLSSVHVLFFLAQPGPWCHDLEKLSTLLASLCGKSSGPWFNIKMSSYQYRKSHCGDKTVVRSSYLHNVISYTGKMTSLYWFGPLITSRFPLTKKPVMWCFDVFLNASLNKLLSKQLSCRWFWAPWHKWCQCDLCLSVSSMAFNAATHVDDGVPQGSFCVWAQPRRDDVTM